MVYCSMDAQKKSTGKIDKASLGYGLFIVGVTAAFFELAFSGKLSVSLLLVGVGVVLLALFDRTTLLQMIFPFRLDSGKNSARYLGVMGIVTYTLSYAQGWVDHPDYPLFTGLLLIAASASWYLIRLVKFGERGL